MQTAVPLPRLHGRDFLGFWSYISHVIGLCEQHCATLSTGSILLYLNTRCLRLIWTLQGATTLSVRTRSLLSRASASTCTSSLNAVHSGAVSMLLAMKCLAQLCIMRVASVRPCGCFSRFTRDQHHLHNIPALHQYGGEMVLPTPSLHHTRMTNADILPAISPPYSYDKCRCTDCKLLGVHLQVDRRALGQQVHHPHHTCHRGRGSHSCKRYQQSRRQP